MKDLYNNLACDLGTAPVAQATDNTAVASAVIDMQGYESLLFIIILGALADADATFTVLVEEDDAVGMGTATEVADVDLEPTEAIMSFDFADDNSVRRMGIRPTKRYVQVTITPASNTGNWMFASAAIKGHAHVQPQTAQAT